MGLFVLASLGCLQNALIAPHSGRTIAGLAFDNTLLESLQQIGLRGCMYAIYVCWFRM